MGVDNHRVLRTRGVVRGVLSDDVPERRLHVGIGAFVETCDHAAGIAASRVITGTRKARSLVTTLDT